MASLKLKYTATMISGLIAGGLISVAAYHYIISGPASAPSASVPEKQVLYWYDPMKPDTKFDKPGKSPFMDMELVPKYREQGEGEESPGIHINPTLVQNLGLKTEKSALGQVQYQLTLPGNINFNDYQFVRVQARANGFVERVYPLAIGDSVSKGTPLVDITIPDWVEAQSEYLLLTTSGTASQINGVIERLRLAGMPEEDIQRLKSSRRIQTHFTLKAPIDGVLTAFDLRTGMNITKENIVAQIQGIDPIWVTAAIPENAASLLNKNSHFSLSVPAYAGQSFAIKRWSLLPSADATTRTLQLRLEVDNPAGRLKPGMNATLALNSATQSMVLIPSQAVIDTGHEQRVITVDDAGHFVPKLIKVLAESGGKAGVSGLHEGESVVVNGLFLIDAEANINGALARMRQDAGPDSGHADAHHQEGEK